MLGDTGGKGSLDGDEKTTYSVGDPCQVWCEEKLVFRYVLFRHICLCPVYVLSISFLCLSMSFLCPFYVLLCFSCRIPVSLIGWCWSLLEWLLQPMASTCNTPLQAMTASKGRVLFHVVVVIPLILIVSKESSVAAWHSVKSRCRRLCRRGRAPYQARGSDGSDAATDPQESRLICSIHFHVPACFCVWTPERVAYWV